MVLVFFIAIVSIFLLYILACIFSTLHLKVDKIQVSNDNQNRKLEYDYEIHVTLYFFNKIKILNISIDKEKIEKLQLTKKIQTLDIKKMEKELASKEERKKILNMLDLQLTKFIFHLEIGTEDVIITSGIVAILSAVLGIALAKVIKHYEQEKYQYKIMPIYQNRNVLKLNLNCIIQVKLVHIIYMIFVLLKRRRVEKHERTSNRRTYDYSYE